MWYLCLWLHWCLCSCSDLHLYLYSYVCMYQLVPPCICLCKDAFTLICMSILKRIFTLISFYLCSQPLAKAWLAYDAATAHDEASPWPFGRCAVPAAGPEALRGSVRVRARGAAASKGPGLGPAGWVWIGVPDFWKLACGMAKVLYSMP